MLDDIMLSEIKRQNFPHHTCLRNLNMKISRNYVDGSVFPKIMEDNRDREWGGTEKGVQIFIYAK